MIVAIEGPRNSGKTSLAEVVAPHLGWELEHWDPPQIQWNTRRDFVRAVEGSSGNEPSKVWDRAWAGRHVYGNLRHHYEISSDTQLRHELLMSGTIQPTGLRLVLLPNLAILQQRLEPTDKQQFTVQEEHQRWESLSLIHI